MGTTTCRRGEKKVAYLMHGALSPVQCARIGRYVLATEADGLVFQEHSDGNSLEVVQRRADEEDALRWEGTDRQTFTYVWDTERDDVAYQGNAAAHFRNVAERARRQARASRRQADRLDAQAEAAERRALSVES